MSTSLSIPAALVDAIAKRVEHLQNPAGFTSAMRRAHVLYGGAHLFKADTPAKIGDRARASMETWGSDDAAFARAIGMPEGDPNLASRVAARVRAKLASHPLEAMCIDFEDGFGPRSDDEEDEHAIRAATSLASLEQTTIAIGIRIKALAEPTLRRAIRTLDLFLTTLVKSGGSGAGSIAPGFSVTLPKITSPEEVACLADLLEHLERTLGIKTPIAIELMIEAPRALVAEDGTIAVPSLVKAGEGRVVAVHLGAYDLTAELGVTAGDQRLDHPYCDLARMLLRLSLGDSHARHMRVAIADGATTVLPIGSGAVAIHRAWSLHASNVKRAIDVGIWQGWDLHPAQLPARYGALFAHFLSHEAELTTRLTSFLEKKRQASRVGQMFDDAATGNALVAFFERGVACGAFDAGSIPSLT